MRRHTVICALATLVSGAAHADTVWSDDFESYASGSWIHDQGGWRGWDGNPDWAASVTNQNAHGGSNSLLIRASNDPVQQFTDLDCGRYELSAWTYVPSTATVVSTFILLNTYEENGPKSWSTQVGFNPTNGRVGDGHDGTWIPLIPDEWVPIRMEIDLDADTQTFWYGDTMLYTGCWAEYMFDENGVTSLGALDLYGGSSGNGGHFFDDIVLTRIGLGDVNLDGSVGFEDLLDLLSAWGSCPDPPDVCRADFDCDGQVGLSDLLVILTNWGD